MEDMLEESEVSWLESLEEELIMQEVLFDAEPVPLAPPQLTAAEPEPQVRNEQIVNILVSKVYSGPTIGDIESALSLSCSNDKPPAAAAAAGRNARSGLAAKMENKYTLRIKTCVNGVVDDGYKWRKYGQKLIKNSPNPRSYYRCTNPRCNAKKQVERSTEDPETAIVTYEGLHLHYTYSHFLVSQKHVQNPASLDSAKKPKIQTESQARESEGQQQTQPIAQTLQKQKKALFLEDILLENPSMKEKNIQNGLLTDVERPQGMLEDVVPLMVRKPCSSATPSNEPSYSSQECPPSHYSSLLSPSSSQIDKGILSSILTGSWCCSNREVGY